MIEPARDQSRSPFSTAPAAAGDGLSPGSGRHNFFYATYLSMALSGMDSANSFLSLAFPSSSAFSRLASETSRPPNLAFHFYYVAFEIPCLRHTSAVATPASCSRRIIMICSSVNRLDFIVHPIPT